MRALVMALVLLAGCATHPPVGPPAAAVPDLRGTWTGTWGGAPASLVVTEQQLGQGESGLVLGPWQVLGERYPTATGVLTASVNGQMISTHMTGRFSDSGAGVVLTVQASSTSAGDQWLQLRLVDGQRLEGMGESQYGWGPQGPVQLVRRRAEGSAGCQARAGARCSSVSAPMSRL
jgi:hypothetical protein